MRAVVRAFALGLLAMSFLAVGCGLFETRDPLEPPPPAGSGCRDLTSTAAAFANIVDSTIGYGTLAGVTCYASMLDTAFLFHPDPQDSVQELGEVPFPFRDWNETVESSVNSNIALDVDFIQVSFPEAYSPTIFPDSRTEVHFRTYLLYVSKKASPDTLRYTGLADLTFHQGADAKWRITNWTDHRGSVSDSTWGQLRRDYRVGV